MKPPPKTALETIPDPFVRTLLVRLAMLLVLAGSVCLVWWSVNRLTLVNRQLKQKSSAVSALADEVQQLERNLDPAEVRRTETRFQQAKESLFAGPEERTGWLKELEAQARALGLEATLQPGPAQPHPRAEPRLSLLAATIELQPMAGSPSTNFPYQRLLNFTGILQKPKERIDLLELFVVGGSNSFRQAKAAVQLWSLEGKP